MNEVMKKYLLVALIGFCTGLAGVYVGWNLMTSQGGVPPEVAYSSTISESNSGEFHNAPIHNPVSERSIAEIGSDFSYASERTTPSVVFIQTLSEYEYRTGSWLDWFFEPRTSQQIGSGSGVILSQDGYIVTNNHVIDDADVIKVTHNKKSYDAQLIGVDPSTDLAVIKIEGKNLPAVNIGKSDQVKVGEWVLAVGNPFNLTSTVTAGIVSAKGRNINILRDKFPIESFIQTDAAINPGNSGGALVNQKGELIGINTAILSKTGSYTGYGFAVPSNIVKKVYNDIVKYGEVQKAFIGAEYVDIDSDMANKMQLTNLNGVIVANVQKQGAAAKAGLEKGDVLRMVNGTQIISKAYLEEYIGNLYPGDELTIVLQREGKEITKNITLTNREGTTGIIVRNLVTSEYLAATFENVSKVERDLIGINNGVKVVDYNAKGFFAGLGIPEGFIITNINNTAIENPKELIDILEKIRGRVIISGIDKRGRKVYYPYYF